MSEYINRNRDVLEQQALALDLIHERLACIENLISAYLLYVGEVALAGIETSGASGVMMDRLAAAANKLIEDVQ